MLATSVSARNVGVVVAHTGKATESMLPSKAQRKFTRQRTAKERIRCRFRLGGRGGMRRARGSGGVKNGLSRRSGGGGLVGGGVSGQPKSDMGPGARSWPGRSHELWPWAGIVVGRFRIVVRHASGKERPLVNMRIWDEGRMGRPFYRTYHAHASRLCPRIVQATS